MHFSIDSGKSDNAINKLADLAGKTVLASNGDASAALLEKYNAKHPDKKITLKYGDWTLEQQNTRFLFDKSDTELKTKLDKGIKKLRDSGELKKLSKQYLNGDFSEQVEEKTLEL